MGTDLDVNTLFMVTSMSRSCSACCCSSRGRKLQQGGAGLVGQLPPAARRLDHAVRRHGSIPAWASIDLANAVLYGSFALTWSGARVFDRRSAEPVWCMVGVIIWLLACRLPQFAASIELRALVGSFIVTTYTWLAAYEFWRGRD